MSDRGVVEGAAAPLDEATLQEIREALETAQPTPGMTMDDGSPHFTDEALVARMRFLQSGHRWCAALVADREALLEHIRQLEDQLRLVARTLEPIAYPGKQLLGAARGGRGGGRRDV